MPGTFVAIGWKSPRTSTGAFGFMSHKSIWLGPPNRKMNTHDFAFCDWEEFLLRDFACSFFKSIEFNLSRLRPPTWSNSRRVSELFGRQKLDIQSPFQFNDSRPGMGTSHQKELANPILNPNYMAINTLTSPGRVALVLGGRITHTQFTVLSLFFVCREETSGGSLLAFRC